MPALDVDLGPELCRDQRVVHPAGVWSLFAGLTAGVGALVCAGGCLAGVGTGRFDDWLLVAGTAAVLAAGVLGLASVLTVVARRLTRRVDTVVVHQRGLVFRSGRTTRVFPWNRLLGYYRPPDTRFGAPRDTPLRITLTHEDQSRLELSGFPDLPAVGVEIERLTALTWMAPWTAALQRGEPVPFGPVTLDRSGVQGFGEPVPWAEVQGLRADAEGHLVLVARAGPRRGPLFTTVPNPHVLVALVERRAGR